MALAWNERDYLIAGLLGGFILILFILVIVLFVLYSKLRSKINQSNPAQYYSQPPPHDDLASRGYQEYKGPPTSYGGRQEDIYQPQSPTGPSSFNYQANPGRAPSGYSQQQGPPGGYADQRGVPSGYPAQQGPPPKAGGMQNFGKAAGNFGMKAGNWAAKNPDQVGDMYDRFGGN